MIETILTTLTIALGIILLSIGLSIAVVIFGSAVLALKDKFIK